MRFAVLGSGRVGSTMARDLLKHGASRVFLLDSDWRSLSRFGETVRDRRLYLAWADFSELTTLAPILREVHACISAAPYALNPDLARASVERGVSFIDLGGHTDSVKAVLRLGRLARKRACYAVPDCGLAPGLANVLAGEAVRRVGRARSLKVLVDGLPVKPTGPLKHELLFSEHGFINEYVSPAWCLERRRRVAKPPLTAIEDVPWPPLGTFEAFRTGGSSSTLSESFRGAVDAMETKTIRYPGHLARVLALRRRVGAKRFPQALVGALKPCVRDFVLLRVEAAGPRKRVAFEMVDREKGGERSLWRTTAYPAAITAMLAAQRMLGAYGAKVNELDVPADAMIAGLAERGIVVETREAPVAREGV